MNNDEEIGIFSDGRHMKPCEIDEAIAAVLKKREGGDGRDCLVGEPKEDFSKFLLRELEGIGKEFEMVMEEIEGRLGRKLSDLEAIMKFRKFFIEKHPQHSTQIENVIQEMIDRRNPREIEGQFGALESYIEWYKKNKEEHPEVDQYETEESKERWRVVEELLKKVKSYK